MLNFRILSVLARGGENRESQGCGNMRIYFLFSCLFLGLVLAGCGTTIARNLRGTNDSWDIEIVEVRDGRNFLNAPYMYITPWPGNRFIWLTVRIQNNTPAAQEVNLQNFLLMYDQTSVKAYHFYFDTWLEIASSSEITLEPNQSIRRRIVFEFPINKQPRRVRVPNVGDIPVELLTTPHEKKDEGQVLKKHSGEATPDIIRIRTAMCGKWHSIPNLKSRDSLLNSRHALQIS